MSLTNEEKLAKRPWRIKTTEGSLALCGDVEFEYKLVELPLAESEFVAELNRLGKEGWQYCQSFGLDGLWFKALMMRVDNSFWKNEALANNTRWMGEDWPFFEEK